MQRSTAFLLLVVVGCADSASSGGAGAAGGGESAGAASVGGAASEFCTSIYEETKVEPHADFAACASKPNATCDVVSFCAANTCGGKDASFDSNGCRRALCEEDADCAPGERCYDTDPRNSIDAPCSVSVYACCQAESGCFCMHQQDCPTEKHCVDEAEL